MSTPKEYVIMYRKLGQWILFANGFLTKAEAQAFVEKKRDRRTLSPWWWWGTIAQARRLGVVA